MSKLTKTVEEQRKSQQQKSVVNFMEGISYEYHPIDTLKMVTASSIFGEPQYYRDGIFSPALVKDAVYHVMCLFEPYNVLPDRFKGLNTSEMMEKIIDEALDFDFRSTIEWAVTLRKEFLMRLNPQIIMVRAAIHPDRKAFNEKHPGLFSRLQRLVMQRGDEPVSQLEYYLFKHGSKKGIPNLLKRNWAARLEQASLYELYKYKNAGIGLIDTIRICHAHSSVIDELMTTGTISVESDNTTWEASRASGMQWREILSVIWHC